jgi:hypothetical protein
VRDACAVVAANARFVHIDAPALEVYAQAVPLDEVGAGAGPALPGADDAETRSAFVLTLDAINFGSGWFPHLRKRAGMSGYRTIESALVEHFDREGPLDSEALALMTPVRCAGILDQPLADPEIADLIGLYARAWRDLGELIDGAFAPFVGGCRGSGAELVRRLLRMPLYRDVAEHQGRHVPLLKRAQITVADLHLALPEATGHFGDLDELTLFADNLVPHVLRLDGVLRFDRELEARIDREELIPSGSPEEVEIRAVAVHAVEVMSAHSGLPAWRLDNWLWARGAQQKYKARPRHRTRCSYY